MCGIAGIRRMGTEPIWQWQCDTLLNSLEYRGVDATGIAIQQRDGQIHVLKDNVQAWRFTASSTYKDFLKEHLGDDTQTVLLHTRKATKGNPYRNENNHPLTKGECAVVHNGAVRNDDWLFTDLKLERGAETDSDAIRAIVDRWGITKKVIEKLNKIAGTVAAAVVSPKYPGKVLLLRSGNPLVIGHSPKFDHLVWASDKRSIYRATKPWVSRWNFLMQTAQSDIAFLNMYDNSGYILGDKGLEWHDEFKATNNYGGNLNYQVYGEDYFARQKRQHEEAHPAPRLPIVAPRQESLPVVGDASGAVTLSPRYVYCPNPICKGPKSGQPSVLILSDADRLQPLHRLECKRCHTNLVKAKVKPILVN